MKKIKNDRKTGNKHLINLQNKIANNHVGANCVRPQTHRGITLIALIITIIVMLILVSVTINVVLETGLFDKLKESTKETQLETDRETLLTAVMASLNEDLQIQDVKVLQKNLPSKWNIEGTGLYTVTSPKGNIFRVDNRGNIRIPIELPEGWTEIEKPEEWNSNRIIAITDGENIIPLPDGYGISDVKEEQTIEKGLVIKDSKGNEFVWIPVTENFKETYSSKDNCLEPKELTDNYLTSNTLFDSQDTLDYIYGKGYYNYEVDFAYRAHYSEMIESVNKYNGFYIGRYETTINENNEIGSVINTTVLSSIKTLPQTNNKACRWYGLYYLQRNSNVDGNNDYIQTSMIWGQQWDAMIKYFDNKSIDYSEWGKSKQRTVVNSGQSRNESGLKDEIYNIYDLRTNGNCLTAEAYSSNSRTYRGGYANVNYSAAYCNEYCEPTGTANFICSRLIFYIK